MQPTGFNNSYTANAQRILQSRASNWEQGFSKDEAMAWVADTISMGTLFEYEPNMLYATARDDMRQFVDRMDTNNDGTIGENELSHLLQQADQLDSGKPGTQNNQQMENFELLALKMTTVDQPYLLALAQQYSPEAAQRIATQSYSVNHKDDNEWAANLAQESQQTNTLDNRAFFSQMTMDQLASYRHHLGEAQGTQQFMADLAQGQIGAFRTSTETGESQPTELTYLTGRWVDGEQDPETGRTLKRTEITTTSVPLQPNGQLNETQRKSSTELSELQAMFSTEETEEEQRQENELLLGTEVKKTLDTLITQETLAQLKTTLNQVVSSGNTDDLRDIITQQSTQIAQAYGLDPLPIHFENDPASPYDATYFQKTLTYNLGSFGRKMDNYQLMGLSQDAIVDKLLKEMLLTIHHEVMHYRIEQLPWRRDLPYDPEVTSRNNALREASRSSVHYLSSGMTFLMNNTDAPYNHHNDSESPALGPGGIEELVTQRLRALGVD